MIPLGTSLGTLAAICFYMIVTGGLSMVSVKRNVKVARVFDGLFLLGGLTLNGFIIYILGQTKFW